MRSYQTFSGADSARGAGRLKWVGIRLAFGLLFLSAFSAGARAKPTDLQPIVGLPSGHLIEEGETLHDVAYLHRLGFEAIERLNPEVDPWIPPPGTVVRLPTWVVLPSPTGDSSPDSGRSSSPTPAPARPGGLVINVPEMRLYDFTLGSQPEQVAIHAVAVGDADDPTPIGLFRIGRKQIDPVWYVPKSIRMKRPDMPLRVPPGEDNPLGSRWMTIGNSSYGLHGTNVRWSIGRVSTHGCVRLYEDVIQSLFERIPEGTSLELIYQPFKWGRIGDAIFLEVHPDLYGRISDPLLAAEAVPRALGLLPRLDREQIARVVEEAAGIPVRIRTERSP